MARHLRFENSVTIYHITSRGNEKKNVFKDDTDRETFLKSPAHVKKTL